MPPRGVRHLPRSGVDYGQMNSQMYWEKKPKIAAASSRKARTFDMRLSMTPLLFDGNVHSISF